MDRNGLKQKPNDPNVDPLEEFNERELKLLEEREKEGVKPIAASLAVQLFELYVEGYSCLEIAKLNKGLDEADILYCRKIYQWDHRKKEYVTQLMDTVRDKMHKHKLESVEFLTNMLSVTHKKYKKQMMKYLQTGKEEDIPETWVKGTTSYKAIIEILQKHTGEDKKPQKFEHHHSGNLNVSNQDVIDVSPKDQSKILSDMASTTEKNKKDDKKKK